MPDKRRLRLTRAQIEELDVALVGFAAEQRPCSVRNLFYRCVSDPALRRLCPKTEQGYERIVRRVLELRRDRRLPWEWITDSSRHAIRTGTWSGPGAFLEAAAEAYRWDLWGDTGVRVEVWCESRSAAGYLEEVCEQYAVALFPTGGFSSESFLWEAAGQLREHVEAGGIVRVVMVSDLDPAGLLIPEHVERTLREHLPDGVDLRSDRVCLTAEQVEEHGLEGKPRKAGDLRRLDVTETWEVEALPASVVRKCVSAAIAEHLRPGALETAAAHDATGRRWLLASAGGVGP